MSANDTNPTQETKRHFPSLLAIAASLTFGAVLFLTLFGWTVIAGDVPEGADAMIDGRTGEVTE